MTRVVLELFSEYLWAKTNTNTNTNNNNIYYINSFIEMYHILGKEENINKLLTIRNIALNEGLIVEYINHI